MGQVIIVPGLPFLLFYLVFEAGRRLFFVVVLLRPSCLVPCRLEIECPFVQLHLLCSKPLLTYLTCMLLYQCVSRECLSSLE